MKYMKDVKCKTCESWKELGEKTRKINLGTKEKPDFIRSGRCADPRVSGKARPDKDTLVFGSLRSHATFGCVLHTPKK